MEDSAGVFIWAQTGAFKGVQNAGEHRNPSRRITTSSLHHRSRRRTLRVCLQDRVHTQLDKGKGHWECIKSAKIAYRKSLPCAGTLEAVRAFIACVAQGINFEIYSQSESTRLLYAAQVALTAYKRTSENG